MTDYELRRRTCLALRQLTKCYQYQDSVHRFSASPPAVDAISMAVFPGECFGLLGVNGAGKTTLLRMITGDLDPTQGQIYVNGFQLASQLREAQQSMGYCPQFDALLDYLTGRETLQLFGRLRGMKEPLLVEEINYLLRALHLSSHANTLVRHYSGGKRRRLSAAVALVGGTPLICLDEPTTGVDPVSRRRMWNLFQHCCRLGRTILLTSHSQNSPGFS
ncbi:unnamed protein product [Protopolystoma xenopodis]|uniref:ABC transporter domain-containing protein n=1 Tax=Protopolystoma xenopodis TaxID=117903 RepID=A0A448X0P5_9PLAT|nr:unnamed protein product [Protopolystoma xenopodis]